MLRNVTRDGQSSARSCHEACTGRFGTESRKAKLLERIEDRRDVLVEFLRGFIRCPSPNPPGDTREAAAHIRRLLRQRGVEHRVIAPQQTMPNIVATFAGSRPGRHLALNGHIDVFPVGDGAGWSQDPWGGALVDGRIYGRGACDMKCGTTASISTFLYLHEMHDELHGQLTLSAVSDEETFGSWGARYLFENHPEVIGDCCLNGEPSSPWTVRFGEKGPLWLEFTVRTSGVHGAYTHLSRSATAIAARIIGELEQLQELPAPEASNLAAALDQAADVIVKAYGPGASKIIRRVTVNPGAVHGGFKVNMVASHCTFEMDIRIKSDNNLVSISDDMPICENDSRSVDKEARALNHLLDYRVLADNIAAWCWSSDVSGDRDSPQKAVTSRRGRLAMRHALQLTTVKRSPRP